MQTFYNTIKEKMSVCACVIPATNNARERHRFRATPESRVVGEYYIYIIYSHCDECATQIFIFYTTHAINGLKAKFFTS